MLALPLRGVGAVLAICCAGGPHVLHVLGTFCIYFRTRALVRFCVQCPALLCVFVCWARRSVDPLALRLMISLRLYAPLCACARVRLRARVCECI